MSIKINIKDIPPANLPLDTLSKILISDAADGAAKLVRIANVAWPTDAASIQLTCPANGHIYRLEVDLVDGIPAPTLVDLGLP